MYLENVADLRRFVARRLSADAVDDAVSEIFLVAWRRQHDYRHDQARLWLFTVARGVISNLVRADRRRALLQNRADAEASVRATAHSAGPSQDSRVLQALGALSELDQEVLRLVAWDGLTMADAAKVCQCSQATFRVRLFRARRRLLDRLGPSIANATDLAQSPTDPRDSHEQAR
jgi:RNA polymerase sigma factor (sigma-70 family)